MNGCERILVSSSVLVVGSACLCVCLALLRAVDGAPWMAIGVSAVLAFVVAIGIAALWRKIPNDDRAA